MRSKVAFISVVFSLIFIPIAFCGATSLYPQFAGKTVKVFVANVKDSTQERPMNAALVKAKLEEGLRNRKSINFKIVPASEGSDLIVEANIIGYLWTDHDPIDMIVGVGATAMDAALVEDYASTEIDVTVIETRSRKPIWKNRIFATVTKKPMPKEASVPLVIDNFVKTFIKDCFSKRSSSR